MFLQFNTTQDYFNFVGYPYTYATCFGLHLGYPWGCQYKTHTKENTKSSCHHVPFTLLQLHSNTSPIVMLGSHDSVTTVGSLP
jgi:hypothetical protein